MKKYMLTILLGAFICCFGIVTAQTPANRTVSTIVADVSAQLPAANQSGYNQLMEELCATGAEGVKSLVNKMSPLGKGDHAAVAYALSGLAHYASGDEVLKSKMEQAYLEALDMTEERETKAFLMSQLSMLGSEAGVNKLSGYLTDDALSSPAARTIVSIGGETAAKALQMALMRRNTRSVEAQRTIIQALGEVTPIEGTEALLHTMLHTDDVTTKGVVVQTLGKIGTRASLPDLAAAAASAGYKYDMTNVTDAYVQLIKRVYEQGDTKDASAAAQKLLKNATKAGITPLRIAAFGVVLDTQEDKLKALKAALKDHDTSYRNAALRYASDYADKAMYTELFKLLPKAAKEEKIDLLNWIGNEAQCPVKRNILKTIETGIEKTGTQTLVQQLSVPDADIIQAAASALAKIGNSDAVPALSELFQRSDDRFVALAKSIFSSFDGETSPAIVKAIGTASDGGKKAALELLALRKANAYFNVILEQTKSASPEVEMAAYNALKDVVSEKDLVVLCGLLETSEPAVVKPLQQAVIAALSTMSPAEQTAVTARRMLQAGDSKKYLYYPVLSSTGDADALAMIVKGFETENGAAKEAAFDALIAWKGVEAGEPLYDICKKAAGSPYFDRALDAYITLASDADMTGDNRLLFLRKAMEVAQTDGQKNNILKHMGQIGTFPAMICAGEFLDHNALKENAAQAVMNIALANKSFTGEKVKELLEKAALALNNPDADYQRQEIRKYLDEMPEGAGSVSIFNGKDPDHPQPYQLSEAEKKEGFKILFDGTNMHEWTGNLVDYQLEDGCISLSEDTKSGGNLYTKKEYADFVYRFEFQLTPAANNGIGIRAPMEGDAAYAGMELQVLDSEHPVYKDLQIYQYHGSVYGIMPAKRGYLKPVGEWNTQEIVADGNHIKVTLNGTVILDGDIKEATKNGTPDKKEHPGLFNKSGHIAFLGHGSPVKFRNIRIKELK